VGGAPAATTAAVSSVHSTEVEPSTRSPPGFQTQPWPSARLVA
jgi:hypothetical protein